MKGSAGKTAFLKECMASALFQLMETRPLEKIAVHEITALAGVGRSTYFRHCDSKQELLSFYLVRQWEQWAAEHSVRDVDHSDPYNALPFFQFLLSIQKELALLYRQGQDSILLHSFQKSIVESKPPYTPKYYASSFYAYGLYGLLDCWVQSGFQNTPKEMAHLFASHLGGEKQAAR